MRTNASFILVLYGIIFLLGCILLVILRGQKDCTTFVNDYAQTAKHFQRAKGKRVQLLSLDEFSAVLNQKSRSDWRWADLYNGLVPEVFCEGLTRLGQVGDGGKWTCRPWIVPDNCAIYSLGVNQDSSFERQIQELTDSRCRLYAYDKNAPKKADVLEGFEQINAKFKAALVGSKNDPSKNQVSIQDEMKEHRDEKIEILKIDIEGAEFSVLPELMKHTKICQILVEMHGQPHEVLKLMRTLAKGGYRLFSYEINGKLHHLSEYSFIHDDCLEQYNALPYAFYLQDL